MSEYELHKGLAGIELFCQAKAWTKILKTSVACEMTRDGKKERFVLRPNTSTFIPIPANVNCEIRVGVIQIGINTLSHIAHAECMLQEGEVQTFIYAPPLTSFNRSVLVKGEIRRGDVKLE